MPRPDVLGKYTACHSDLTIDGGFLHFSVVSKFQDCSIFIIRITAIRADDYLAISLSASVVVYEMVQDTITAGR